MSCMVPGSYDSSIYIFLSFISTAQSKETANTIKKKSFKSFEDPPDEDKEKIKNYVYSRQISDITGRLSRADEIRGQ